MKSTRTRALAGVCAVGWTTGVCVAQPRVVGIGFLPGGGWSWGMAVSDSGAVVIGTAQSGPTTNGFERACRWTAQGGLVSLGVAPELPPFSYGVGVSGDGATAAGIAGGSYELEAFRWTAQTGIQTLGFLSGGLVSLASGLSSDGRVVVGWGTAAGGFGRGFQWTVPSGMSNLGTLPGFEYSEAVAVNHDGSIIVGRSSDSGIPVLHRAVRWSAGSGVQSLGVPAGWTSSRATTVNRTGDFVAGVATTNGGTEGVAFRWSGGAGGMQSLGVLPGRLYSTPTGITADGRVVVGESFLFSGPERDGRAFLWTPGTGIQDLNTYLAARGYDLSDWVLTAANGITPDGRAVVGTGRHDRGHGPVVEGWIVPLWEGCYANRDQSTTLPVLNILDFLAFLEQFGAGSVQANCDGSGITPLLTINDFGCFLSSFAAGCS